VLSAAAAPEVDVGPVGRLAAGAEHTCAILTDRTVACWGAGTNGRLGYGDINDVGDDEAPRAAGAVDLGGGQASALAVGAAHTCATVPAIAMRCWGAFAEGRLGNNAMEDIGDAETPAMSQAVAGSGGALAIAAGAAHTCFLDGSGQVRCFGRGTNGQLGYGATTSLPAPGGPVEIGNAATALVAGDDHTCAVQIDDAVRCWGRGLDGRLGSGNTMDIGTISDPGVFAPVGLGGGARALAAGARHTCALLTSGGVICWGANDHGQLGYGDHDVGRRQRPAVGRGDGAAARRGAGDHRWRRSHLRAARGRRGDLLGRQRPRPARLRRPRGSRRRRAGGRAGPAVARAGSPPAVYIAAVSAAPDPATIAAALAHAQGAHPDLTLTAAAFAARAAAVDATALATHGADLFLAWACLAGDPVALRRFDDDVLRPASDGARAIDRAPAFLDEVRQRVRAHLLVGEGGRGCSTTPAAARCERGSRSPRSAPR
jgi:hypothetical protein